MVDEKFNFTFDGSAEYARRSLQLTLKNVGVDYIDLYILRSKDPKVPFEESVRAMAVSVVSLPPCVCIMFQQNDLLRRMVQLVTLHPASTSCPEYPTCILQLVSLQL